MIKGQKILAPALAVIEVFVYISGLTIILNNLDSYWNIAAYCIGYGLGVYVGSMIEERLALGYLTMQVIVDSIQSNVAERLREKGFGVTSWTAQGREGDRLVMEVLTKRNRQKELIKIIDELCPKAFVVYYEPKNFKGGFWIGKM